MTDQDISLLIIILLFGFGAVYYLYMSVSGKPKENTLSDLDEILENPIKDNPLECEVQDINHLEEYLKKEDECYLSYCCHDLSINGKCIGCNKSCMTVTSKETKPYLKLLQDKKEHEESNSELPFYKWKMLKEESKLVENMSFTEWLKYKSKGWDSSSTEPPV
ncbi:MAG: hypothetical protein SLAVMIC_00791 [uncultured marine phage]|uniref:Uncharacterized protein n=1 Tax=uncultured marine phage TaxID=707152 RepID=A0A8D9FR33_9VIRU|nr:MAG: hypothetical protein SLAVMIC_00791 [uncultured marine phage]